MANYVQLISSINPVEIDQIKFALKQENIETKIVGETALLAGNLELTGIAGADIKVPEEKLVLAKKVLKELGYSIENFKKSGDPIRLTLIALAIGFLIVILYMAYVLI